ncbi:MAG: DUF1961 family protein [Chitinophagaceae bacterium]|nr:DUF1961 family protein [Chitinophagaceae bacterium]
MVPFRLILLVSLSIAVENIIAQPGTQFFSLKDSISVHIEGSHRFITINNITGLHSKSLKTRAWIESTNLASDEGSISLWMSPLEDIDKSHSVEGSLVYPLISDQPTANNVDSCKFSIYYRGNGYPRLIGSFTDGSFWGQMDYGLSPFVYAESLKLIRGQWYHIVINWNKGKNSLRMHINGEMVGHNFSAKSFKPAGNKLFIGNPLMVIANVKINKKELSENEIQKAYSSLRPATNQLADSEIKAVVRPVNKGVAAPLDNTWKKVYSCAFNKPADLESWTFQTGDLYRDKFTLETSSEGLLWTTPEIIHTESRGYLWCPYATEGDVCIEYEFQLQSLKGLALLIMCASGTRGEDIIADQGLRKTGSMSDMNVNYRNYHWEYMRRVEAMRTDVETQYVNKNPWGKSLFVGCTERLPQNKWIKIRLMKSGKRISGYLDGKKIFDVEDSGFDNNGPLLNSGRVVLRQMYATSMLYRNFVIYQKK